MVNLDMENENRRSRRECLRHSNSQAYIRASNGSPFCRSLDHDNSRQSNIPCCNDDDESTIIVNTSDHCGTPTLLDFDEDGDFDLEMDDLLTLDSSPTHSGLSIASETSNSSGESTSEDVSEDDTILPMKSLSVPISRGPATAPRKVVKRVIARRISTFPHENPTSAVVLTKFNHDTNQSVSNNNVETHSDVNMKANPLPSTSEETETEKPAFSWLKLFISMLKKSDGREKLVKVGYYGGNSIRWFLTMLSNRMPVITLLSAVHRSASKVSPSFVATSSIIAQFANRSTHKFTEALFETSHILRFGKWISGLGEIKSTYLEWKNLALTSSSGKDRLFAFTRFVITLFGVCAELFDDIEWLCDHQILPESLSSSFGSAAAFLWMVTLFFDISVSLSTLHKLWQSNNCYPTKINASNSNFMTKINDESIRDESVSFFQQIGDLVISSSLVSAHRGRDWNNGLIQCGGFLSGMMSLYQYAHK